MWSCSEIEVELSICTVTVAIVIVLARIVTVRVVRVSTRGRCCCCSRRRCRALMFVRHLLQIVYCTRDVAHFEVDFVKFLVQDSNFAAEQNCHVDKGMCKLLTLG